MTVALWPVRAASSFYPSDRTPIATVDSCPAFIPHYHRPIPHTAATPPHIALVCSRRLSPPLPLRSLPSPCHGPRRPPSCSCLPRAGGAAPPRLVACCGSCLFRPCAACDRRICRGDASAPAGSLRGRASAPRGGLWSYVSPHLAAAARSHRPPNRPACVAHLPHRRLLSSSPGASIASPGPAGARTPAPSASEPLDLFSLSASLAPPVPASVLPHPPAAASVRLPLICSRPTGRSEQSVVVDALGMAPGGNNLDNADDFPTDFRVPSRRSMRCRLAADPTVGVPPDGIDMDITDAFPTSFHVSSRQSNGCA